MSLALMKSNLQVLIYRKHVQSIITKNVWSRTETQGSLEKNISLTSDSLLKHWRENRNLNIKTVSEREILCYHYLPSLDRGRETRHKHFQISLLLINKSNLSFFNIKRTVYCSNTLLSLSEFRNNFCTGCIRNIVALTLCAKLLKKSHFANTWGGKFF
jgi:hypothetical protein